jgi:serine/threonine-protein kinase SRPK3
MLEATGESFPETMLVKSPKRTEFLDANGKRFRPHIFKEELRGLDDLKGNLLRIGVVFPNSLERMLTTYNVLRPGDIAPTAAFLRACLRLDPSKRPSAGELLGHRWLVGAGYQQVDSRSGIL